MMYKSMEEMLEAIGKPLSEEAKERQRELVNIARIMIPGYDETLEFNRTSGAEQIAIFRDWVNETLTLDDEAFAKKVRPLLLFAFGIEPIWTMQGIDYLAGKHYSLKKSLQLSAERTAAQKEGVRKRKAVKAAKIAIQQTQGCTAENICLLRSNLENMVSPRLDSYGKESKESRDYRKEVSADEISAATNKLLEAYETLTALPSPVNNRIDTGIDALQAGEEEIPF